MPVVLKRILIALIAVFVVAALASIGLFVWLMSGIGRFGGHGAEHAEREGSVYLVMVRDSRGGGNDEVLDDSASTTDVGRTDSMMLVRLLPGKYLDVISLPRDLIVNIPACRRSDGVSSQATSTKLNAAYALGAAADSAETGSETGMRCAERTVSDFTVVHIDGVSVIDAVAVRDVVDALGGVDLCVPAPQAEQFDKVPAGCNTIDGDAALEYSRERSNVDDGTDLSRIQRQQKLIKAMAKKLSEDDGPTAVPRLLKVLQGLGPHMRADDAMVTVGSATQVLNTLQSGSFSVRMMPVVPDDDGVNLDPDPDARSIWDAIEHDRAVTYES